VDKCFLFWREKQSAISETYGNNTLMRVTHRLVISKGINHLEFTKFLIIGLIRTVTEADESRRLLADLKRQNGMVKARLFLSICILLVLSSVIINNKDLL